MNKYDVQRAEIHLKIAETEEEFYHKEYEEEISANTGSFSEDSIRLLKLNWDRAKFNLELSKVNLEEVQNV